MEATTHVVRIIKILEWLSMGKSITVQEIWEIFEEESSKRTIQRDFQAIESAGIPLEIIRNDNKEFIYKFPRWYQNMLIPSIEQHELTAFYFLKGYLKSFKNTSLGTAIKSLENKLDILAPGELLSYSNNTFLQDQNFGHIDYRLFTEIINNLIEAIIHKKWVTMSYHSLTDDKMRSYDVFIHKFYQFNSLLYAAVYFPKHNDILALAVHRIKKINISKKQQARPEFNETEFSQKRFGIYKDEPEEVILHIHPDFVKWIKDRIWHPSQIFSDLPEGGLQLKLKVPLSPDFITWVMGWHFGIKVLSPLSLKNKILANLKKSLEGYST